MIAGQPTGASNATEVETKSKFVQSRTRRRVRVPSLLVFSPLASTPLLRSPSGLLVLLCLFRCKDCLPSCQRSTGRFLCLCLRFLLSFPLLGRLSISANEAPRVHAVFNRHVQRWTDPPFALVEPFVEPIFPRSIAPRGTRVPREPRRVVPGDGGSSYCLRDRVLPPLSRCAIIRLLMPLVVLSHFSRRRIVQVTAGVPFSPEIDAENSAEPNVPLKQNRTEVAKVVSPVQGIRRCTYHTVYSV